MNKIYFRPQSEAIALYTEESFLLDLSDSEGNHVQLSRGKKRNDDFDDEDYYDDEYYE